MLEIFFHCIANVGDFLSSHDSLVPQENHSNTNTTNTNTTNTNTHTHRYYTADSSIPLTNILDQDIIIAYETLPQQDSKEEKEDDEDETEGEEEAQAAEEDAQGAVSASTAAPGVTGARGKKPMSSHTTACATKDVADGLSSGSATAAAAPPRARAGAHGWALRRSSG